MLNPMPIRRTEPNDDQVRWMVRAVELARRCVTEPGRPLPSPRVGAVAVAANGELLSEAFRGELSPGAHAEFCMLEKLGGANGLGGSTVYTTLEPCTIRNLPKIPCATRLIDAGVATVYIGMLDPDARIREQGWRALQDAGLETRDFTEGLRERVQNLNSSFVARFHVVTGPRGSISFDYSQNDGRMRIEHNGISFSTRWSLAGHGSIHAYGPPGSLALSKMASEFSDIDDPGVFEFTGHSKHAREGQIVIYKNEFGYALVRIESVLAGPERGDNHIEVELSYELRYDDDRCIGDTCHFNLVPE